MNTKKIIFSSVLIVAVSVFALFSAAALALQTASASATQANAAARLAKIIAKSDTAITARIDDLNKLNTRIAAMVNVSASEKTNISNEVQTNITGLTALKTKIDADTDATTAAADAKTITGSFRIYALVVPQGYIAAAADRVDTISQMMTTIGGKLATRIAADGTAGKDVTALQTALTDLNAKVADAQTQATAAQNGVASLVPDQGNAAQLASNTAALKAARADAKTIMAGLKSLGADTTTTNTTTTQ